MKIKFLGAAREVTGSKHLITIENGKKILLDCGMFQGKGLETEGMNRNLGFEPAEIDHIILSHAHIDHSGLIPYLYKLGFRGSVVCTNATRDLCSIMLADSGHIHESDMKIFNKRRVARGEPPLDPIYTEKEARASMELFIGVAYNRKFNIDNNIRVKFTNSGHMLGSSVVSLEINENGRQYKIGFTGDIGRPSNRILKSPEPFQQCDYLIAESTYGNRLHPQMQEAEGELLKVVKWTCVEKQGKLIIPSFAIGRTQEVVYSLNKFFNSGELPKVSVFVDSPLAVNATEIFRMHTDNLNGDVQRVMEYDPDPFGFKSLKYITKVQDSKKLNKIKKPCIIISASGMMEAGRIKHHLANNISDPRNTVLAVGYCSPITLGARILRGDRVVSIFGEQHEVNADVERIEAFSGHGDFNEMIDYISCQDKNRLKKIFLVHGDGEALEFYKGKLEEAGFANIEIPEQGEEFVLN
ncbi:MAG: MBL fold metallo-hydrolase [Prolixibacteraceae bacterium]|jgi:metallo-beta-lactamase family protein|nr:MBL fold metallo-hydrolase [Bacteroidota bacterium]NLT00223.1 MBL fold metallo-hydrolase [Bacteroidales bacterium]HNU78142.1 MBL fold metallo-hydrolase [Prolixibacteraceae bacterium]HNZ69327.1 MBL fold metallo-hydrolase [Prolixibacteraceae bacterium]HOC87726.1 MBL fold metallo-hydrolase [Prolixibacteraceae bacterium]